MYTNGKKLYFLVSFYVEESQKMIINQKSAYGQQKFVKNNFFHEKNVFFTNFS